jgi:hypothetical protein
MAVITLFVLFVATWIALFLSKSQLSFRRRDSYRSEALTFPPCHPARARYANWRRASARRANLRLLLLVALGGTAGGASAL